MLYEHGQEGTHQWWIGSGDEKRLCVVGALAVIGQGEHEHRGLLPMLGASRFPG
jgi:hypothetical protein